MKSAVKIFLLVFIGFPILLYLGFNAGYFIGLFAGWIADIGLLERSTMNFIFITFSALLMTSFVYLFLRYKIKKDHTSEEERMLQPFFMASIADRIRVVVAIALLGAFPVLTGALVISRTTPLQESLIFGTLCLLYGMIILLYSVMLSEPLRNFYEKHTLSIVPALCFAVYWFAGLYFLSSSSSEFEINTGNLLIIAISVFMLIMGVKLLLMANRTIFDNKARAEQELTFASEIQQQLLQERELTIGETTGFGMSVAAQQVGGDFFYLDSAPGGELTAAIGDISGHSFGAGLVMSMLKTSVEDHISLGHSIPVLFENLNKRLRAQTRNRMFATFGLVSLKNETGEYWNAGHMPLIHFAAKSGKLTEIRRPGPALGLTDHIQFQPAAFEVRTGDYLVLYSDGLVETRDENGDIREIPFFNTVTQEILTQHPSAEEATRMLNREISHHDQSKTAEDDMTLVVIRV